MCSVLSHPADAGRQIELGLGAVVVQVVLVCQLRDAVFERVMKAKTGASGHKPGIGRVSDQAHGLARHPQPALHLVADAHKLEEPAQCIRDEVIVLTNVPEIDWTNSEVGRALRARPDAARSSASTYLTSGRLGEP